jgi:hypothetical protein
MATFSGKLLRDSNGVLCLKLEQYALNDDLMSVPLEELLEEFVDKDVVFEINPFILSTQLKGDN